MDKKYRLPVYIFIFTFTLLAFVQIKLERPIILAERFIHGAGWIEIFLISLYGAIVGFRMQDPAKVPAWRKATWTIFSVVFFGQLAIGLAGADNFLMTGKLHLPIPMMIVAGPVYRGEISVMTILFISTIILTGPAWCSHFCYFGAIDGLASSGKTSREILKHKAAIKSTILVIVVGTAIALRWFKISHPVTTLIAAGFGAAGIIIIAFLSSRSGKMVHCIMYCPIGTIVSIFKKINPFRMYIDSSCTLCMKCTRYCKYDALNPSDIGRMKPAITCTLCGDCLAACHHNSIKYRFLKMTPDSARRLYLVLTISIHAACIALARI